MGTLTESTVLSEVKKTVESTLKIPSDKLDIDARFENLGMDSIIAMELMTTLSNQFNLSITPAQFTNVNTVKELANYIVANSGDAGHSSTDTPETTDQRDRFSGNLPSINRKTFERKVNRTSFRKLLEFINRKYSVDLGYCAFNSIDEITDALVSNHFDELMLHYNLSNDADIDSLRSRDSESEIQHFVIREEARTRAQPIHDIAIIGMSCYFPDAPNPKAFWNNLLMQKSSIREVPNSRWNWEEHYADSANPQKTISKWGALIDDVDCFDSDFFKIPSQAAKMMDPQERLLMQEVYKAFQDAGINVEKISGSKTGVFVGYEYAEYEHYLRKNAHAIEGGPVFSSSSPTYYLANRLSYIFDFCGPSESININCASSAIAINRAYYSLSNNESNLAVVGGVCLNLFAGDYISGTQYGMLSPDGTCAVFDDNANGFTRGEGAGVIILKRLDDAEKDNNRIYGIIKSCHQNNRGRANDISEIKHESITEVIKGCYDKVTINPETISYIEVDGYSTKWGDCFEFEGIKNAFRDSPSKQKHCALGSLKGNIGHLEPASGMASIIKLAMSLHNKKFPSTITIKTLSTFIDIKNPSHPLYIADTTIPFEHIRKDRHTPIRAGINSFADSGANVHILLEEYIPQSPVEEGAFPIARQLFVLSAKNRYRLNDSVERYIGFLSDSDVDVPFENMIYTLQVGREAMDERLAIITSSRKELLEKLIVVKNSSSKKELRLEDQDIYYGSLDQAKKNPFVSLITKDMSNAQVEQSLRTEQWQHIALLWVNGVVIPWEKIWEGAVVQPVSLPTYPFARERCWVDTITSEKTVVTGSSAEPVMDQQITPAKMESIDQAEWLFSMAGNDAKYTSSMQPIEKIELFLKQELALQLQKPLQAIGGDQNYLELGVNSLGVISLIQKINHLLEARLSPSMIFKYTTIRQFAVFLVETYPEKINALGVTKQTQDTNSHQQQINWQEWIPLPAEKQFSSTSAQMLSGQASNMESKQQISHEQVLEKVLWQNSSDSADYEKITF